jgi:preprotein translocase SecE subunit
VFVGLAGLIVVILLTRWVSLWLEYFLYAGTERLLSPTTGAIVTGIAGGVLLAAWLRAFTQPYVQRRVVMLEEGGWFHATAYKSNQGVRVRRATIIGILVLVAAGVWTLVSHRTLAKGPADWAVNIPFTGKVALDSVGDTESFLATLPASEMTQVQVTWTGTGDLTGLSVAQVLSVDAFKAKVKEVLDSSNAPDDVKKRLADASEKNAAVYLLELNRAIHAQLDRLLSLPVFRDDVTRRLRELDNRTEWTDLSKLLQTVEADARAFDKTSELGWEMKVPTAVPMVDRYALRDINEQARPEKNVRVGLNRNPNFKLAEGSIVATSDFDAEVVRAYTQVAQSVLLVPSKPGTDLEKRRKAALDNLKNAIDGGDFKSRLNEAIETSNQPLKGQLETVRSRVEEQFIPTKQALAPATGTVQYRSLTLLPSVRFTVPVLLLVVAIWLAWRVVNMPTFADFLIATEAELNKVSWTTQKRLVQDTIVVLTTVLLMAVFLFATDYFWKTVLSWKPIGVLHIPEDAGKEKQKLEEKRW